METSSTQQAADAARSFRLAMRLRDRDPLAHEWALLEHFERFVRPRNPRGTCAPPAR